MKRWLWYCCCPPSTSRTQAWRGGAMIAFVCSGLSGPLKDREGITGLQPLIVYQDYCFPDKSGPPPKSDILSLAPNAFEGWLIFEEINGCLESCLQCSKWSRFLRIYGSCCVSESFVWLTVLTVFLNKMGYLDWHLHGKWAIFWVFEPIRGNCQMFCLANRVKWECFPSENGMVLH